MKLISMLAIPVVVIGIIAFGIIKRVNVYDCFVEGAKEGLENMFGIVAPLIALMMGIYMLRESGTIDIISGILNPITSFFKIPSEIIPLAILRPISGSASLAVIDDIFKNCGIESLPSKIASVMMGSTETTFYTIAVYFGSIGIKNSRHTIPSALSADFTGMLASVAVVQMLMR